MTLIHDYEQQTFRDQFREIEESKEEMIEESVQEVLVESPGPVKEE